MSHLLYLFITASKHITKAICQPVIFITIKKDETKPYGKHFDLYQDSIAGTVIQAGVYGWLVDREPPKGLKGPAEGLHYT